ncbi:TPA: ribonuclease P protein component 1 [Candidatus Micrarchaeota archaeon]|nr:ribonuclease P protein component 1 [Candidatus Micrarchaeota archaeon]
MGLHPALLGEIIGLRVRVVNATHPGYLGIEGRVVDETKNLLVVETPEGIKKLPKPDIVVEFELHDGERICVDGAEITVRPEERTKKLWRKVHACSGHRKRGH